MGIAYFGVYGGPVPGAIKFDLNTGYGNTMEFGHLANWIPLGINGKPPIWGNEFPVITMLSVCLWGICAVGWHERGIITFQEFQMLFPY